MKTANGNNKVERLINKAKKYMNITLKDVSNKYFQIAKNESELNNKFVTLENNVKLINGKYGMCLMIKSNNMNSPIFVKTWKAMKSNYNNQNLVMFEYDKEIKETDGYDDIYTLNQWFETNDNIKFDKDAFYKA